jgi:hypothetical protein
LCHTVGEGKNWGKYRVPIVRFSAAGIDMARAILSALENVTFIE